MQTEAWTTCNKDYAVYTSLDNTQMYSTNKHIRFNVSKEITWEA